MMQKTFDEIRIKATPILKEAGVTRCGIFGSYVRGDTNKDSDIDILIEAPHNIGLFEYAALRRKLENALEKEVDLVTYNSLHPKLKDRIINEQVAII